MSDAGAAHRDRARLVSASAFVYVDMLTCYITSGRILYLGRLSG